LEESFGGDFKDAKVFKKVKVTGVGNFGCAPNPPFFSSKVLSNRS